jgi:transposase-like protein
MTHATYPPRRMRFSFESRCRIVQLVLAGKSPQAAAAACGASRATGYRLWDRFQRGGWAALVDRRSTPKRQPRRLPPEAEAEIVAARERSGYGPLRLAAIVERPASTIGKVLRRLGRSRLPKPERDPIVRYERERPGELLHVDTKRLARFWAVGKRILQDGVRRSRGAGWQYLHLAIDVDRPRFGGQRLVRRLFVLSSFSRSRPATGSRALSGVWSGCRRSRCSRRRQFVLRHGCESCADGAGPS